MRIGRCSFPLPQNPSSSSSGLDMGGGLKPSGVYHPEVIVAGLFWVPRHPEGPQSGFGPSVIQSDPGEGGA